MRNGIIIDTSISVDIDEMVNCKGVILEVYKGFFCHILEYNPFREFVTDMFEKKETCLNHKAKIDFKILLKRSDCQSTVVLLEKI